MKKRHCSVGPRSTSRLNRSHLTDQFAQLRTGFGALLAITSLSPVERMSFEAYYLAAERMVVALGGIGAPLTGSNRAEKPVERIKRLKRVTLIEELEGLRQGFRSAVDFVACDPERKRALAECHQNADRCIVDLGGESVYDEYHGP